MSTTIALGPLAFAADRLFTLAAMWLFVAVAARMARRGGDAVNRAAWTALIIGTVAARAGDVIVNWNAYSVEPGSILAVWQGGFAPLAGLVAAGVTVLALAPKRRIGFQLAIVIALLGGVYYGLDRITEQPRRGFPSGFVVTTIEGDRLDLDTLRGRPFVVNLWATWCPPCRRELPMVAEVSASASIPVLMIDQGEAKDGVTEFLRRDGMATRNVVIDGNAELSSFVGGGALPTTIFVGADGMIDQTVTGELSRAALLAGIEQIKRKAS